MHPCARCAQIQRTCCQRAEILVTAGDRARIAAHAGRDDFWERRRPADPEYLEHDPDDPNWRDLTVNADGTRNVLRRTSDGCTFLGRHGCELPMEVRPLVCRLYPFDFTERGLATGDGAVADHYCPTALLAPPGTTMLTVLGMRPDEGERWRSALYRELHEAAAGRSGAA
ncbi:MAG: YkgJ family cysteine cluster protein [Phycisphaerales bacterium]